MLMKDAKDSARWRSHDDLWLDHVTLRHNDIEWLSSARFLTLWAVKVPPGLLASLPSLQFLDLRGGSAATLDAIAGCAKLGGLVVNQVRGLKDVSLVAGFRSLQLLSLYGLPQVSEIPSLVSLTSLRRVELGSMKGLSGLTGVHDAPALEELRLLRKVSVAPDDAQRLANHPTLGAFDWYGEDVAVKVWLPFSDKVAKPPVTPMRPEVWFARYGNAVG